MVIHGDLDFFHVDMFNLLFGNLPAYTLSFMNRFLHQLKEVAGDPKYGPEIPKCPIPMETPSWKRDEWFRQRQYKEFLAHSNKVLGDIKYKVIHYFQDAEKFKRVYSDISLFYLCNNMHYLMVYREAIRVRNMYRKNQIPKMYTTRQDKCLPYGYIDKDVI